MVHLQKANFHAQSIYDIDINFLVKLERRVILIDLDNTLSAYNIMVPSAQTYRLISDLKKSGLIPIIISNNREKRVKTYCSQLQVKYLYSTGKPRTKRIKRFLKDLGIDPMETILVGDQILTDLKLGRKLKSITILTEPISKKDQWTTKINRLIDRPLRKHYYKRNMLGREADKRKMEAVS